MEEHESPVEHISEEILHMAERAREAWLKWAAMLSSLYAVLAAIAGLHSGHEANLAMIAQIQASDAWSYYQAKGIKAMAMEMQSSHDPKVMEKIEKYHAEQEDIRKDADNKSDISAMHLHKHEVAALAVTLFQVAISIAAISVLTRLRSFLLVSVVMGVTGLFFFAQFWLI